MLFFFLSSIVAPEFFFRKKYLKSSAEIVLTITFSLPRGSLEMVDVYIMVKDVFFEMAEEIR